MRKLILLFVCFLFVAVNAKADMTQNGRQPRVWDQAVSSVKAGSSQDYTNNGTVFANVIMTGNNATGNAGYIVLTSADNKGNVIDYYLWVDATTTKGGTTGELRMASFPLLTSVPSVMTSFPYGDWRQSTGFTSSVNVANQ